MIPTTLLRARTAFTAVAVLLVITATTAITATIGKTAETDAPPLVGGWSDTGQLNVSRRKVVAATLPDGRIMVTGDVPSVEIYDPVAGTWSLTGSLQTHMYGETITGLADGRVLVIGTSNSSPAGPTKVHIYNVSSGSWGALTVMAGSLNGHTATLLDNGYVLVSGGALGANASAAAYLFDPTTGTWTPTGNMSTPRFQHSATKLADGRVLVTSGDTAEIYDPATGTWAMAADLGHFRGPHAATLLPDGSVLVTGGAASTATERYHPTTNTWTSAGNADRHLNGHTATLLSTGRVLVAGGSFRADATLYDPVLNVWTPAGMMAVARESAAAVPLPNGQALVVGGYDGNFGNKSVEIYTDLPWTSKITVDPGGPVIAYDGQMQFSAMGYDTEGGSRDVTSEVTWASSNPQAATIDSSGLASGVKRGYTTITATLGKAVGSYIAKVEAPLLSLEVSPASPTIVNGFTQQFTATGSFEDGTTGDMTTSVTWTSSSTAVATTDPTGLATSTGPGTTTISATRWEVSASASLTVDAVALQSIAVTPGTATVPKGATQWFTATGTYNNDTTQDLTASVTWASSDTAIATIAGGLATGVTQGVVTITATQGTVSNTAQLTVGPAALVAIEVTPSAPSIAKGITQQFVATGTYTDASTADLTSSATWTSSAGSVAWIVNNGFAFGAGLGTSTIKAKLGSIEGSTTLTVTDAELTEITVTPANTQLAKGLTASFVATGTYTDTTTVDLSSTVTWASSAPSVAPITAGGVATAASEGVASISATLGAMSGNTQFTVIPAAMINLVVSPWLIEIPIGSTYAFIATATYTDGSTKDLSDTVQWTSSSPSSATVDSTGLVKSITESLTTITATLGAFSSAGYIQGGPHVVTSVVVSPSTAQIPKGTTQAFTATATYSDGVTEAATLFADWSSSDVAIATILSSGSAKGEGQGTTTISASYRGQTGTATLTVDPPVVTGIVVGPAFSSLPKGTTGQFGATAVLSDGSEIDKTSEVTWSSSNEAVASISATGLANALGLGDTIITATLGALSGTTNLYVIDGVLASLAVTPGVAQVPLGGTRTLQAIGTLTDGLTPDYSFVATWTSSDPAVATVSNGTVTALTEGTTTITAEFGGFSGTALVTVGPVVPASLAVTPLSATINMGATQQFVATVTYTDGTAVPITDGVVWTSSWTGAATIDASGLATGVTASGGLAATITATLGALQANASLVVTPAALVGVTVTPTAPSIFAGGTKQFTATATYSDGSQNDETLQFVWSSSNTSVATISDGLATGVGAGQTTITATNADGTISDSVVLTVNAVTLMSIAVTPQNPSISIGGTASFAAVGTYNDGSTQSLTALAAWASDDAAVMTMAGNVATGVSAGTTGVTATVGLVKGSTTLTVLPPALLAITVLPTNGQVAVGATLQFTALGDYADGARRDITNLVTWASANSSVASISSSGLATGMLPTAGIAISAQLSGQYASVALRVVPGSATLLSISVTPVGGTISPGSTLQFTATGTYSDGSTQNVTATVTWASSNTAVATVNVTGLASALTNGPTQISATLGVVSDSELLTVAPVFVARIDVGPTTARVPVDGTQLFTATAVRSDATTMDVTATAIWAVGDSAIAKITTEGKGVGTATGIANGSTNVTATFDGVTGTAVFNVGPEPPSPIVSISVSPANRTIGLGSELPFIATATHANGNLSDATGIVVWSVVDSKVATIVAAGADSGRATGVAAGSTLVTATFIDLTGQTLLTVSETPATLESLKVTPANSQIAVGETQQFAAQGTFDDNTGRNVTALVTWQSFGPFAAATINGAGLATGTGVGTTTIQAQLGAISASTNLSVVGAGPDLLAINITPDPPTVAVGASTQLGLTGLYSDSKTSDVAALATWVSDDGGVATVSGGLVTGVSPGQVKIRATIGRLEASVTLNVTGRAAATLTLSNLTQVFNGTPRAVTVVTDPANLTGVVVTYNGSSIPPSAAGSYAVEATLTNNNYEAPPVTGTLVITSRTLKTLVLSAASVLGGGSVTGKVTLSGAAPAGGLTIPLTSSNPAVAGVPDSVIVPARATSATFTVTTIGVPSQATSVISAALGVTKSVTLTVKSPVLSSLTLTPATVPGGALSLGTVTLTSAAPDGGIEVALVSQTPAAASVPPTVFIPAGQTTAQFHVTTSRVTKDAKVVISATRGGVTKKATLTVKKPGRT